MRVVDVEVCETGLGARASARVVPGGRRSKTAVVEFVYRDTPAGAVTSPGNLFATALLGPAAVEGEILTVDAPVSPVLAANLRSVTRVWNGWVSRMHVVDVDAPPAEELRPSLTAASFTGGVDGFFTALRARDEAIDTLITVIGIDGPGLPSLAPLVPDLARAAEEMGKMHLSVHTNSFIYGAMTVRDSFHLGAVLAAATHGLGGTFRRHYFGSGPPMHRVVRSGTHPATDPLFSSETLEFVHDGGEYGRVEKTAAIAHSQVALDHLYPCQSPRRTVGNCGRCNKCRLTALILKEEQVLDRCRTLPASAASARRLKVGIYTDNFEELRDRIGDPRAKRAIAYALMRARIRGKIRPLVRPLVLRWRRLRRRLHHRVVGV